MLRAGVSIADISPEKGVEMTGYPHCPRPNEGVHDPLYAACLYLENGGRKLAWVTLDLLYIGKDYTKQVKEAFPDFKIMLTTTHTHSGPCSSVPVAVEADEGCYVREDYAAFLVDTIKAVIREASENTFDAELGTAIGHVGAEQGVGGNRRDPKGPQDPTVNVLAVRDTEGKVRSILLSYALHPTYLHAESLVVTADYPAYIRRYLSYAAPDAVFMFAQGTSGNQSSRYFRTEQSFEEAARVGTTLGVEVFHLLEKMEYSADVDLKWAMREIDLPVREFPSVEEAEAECVRTRREFHLRQNDGSDYITCRNAELAVFGAENSYAYAKQIRELGSIDKTEFPCELNVIEIGDTMIFTTQGEIFVEYGLALKAASTAKKAFVFEVTNGTLPGYIYTPDAVADGGYEVGNSVFTPETGDLVVATLKEMMGEVR